jgi:cell wall-associated NlpC family hydrolase
MNVVPTTPSPGNYGVSHGSGMVGELIRHATESWAGHAFVYVGNGMIIEAAPPATRIAPAASHPDAIWNLHEPLTQAQRDKIVARAHALVGTPYDYGAYIGLALEILGIKSGKQLDPMFKRDSWRDCSADVADEYGFAGINLRAGLQYPNLITPADLYNRIAKQAGGQP